MRQPGAGLRLRAPGLLVGGQVEHERHLYHGHIGAGLQDVTERVRADQDRLVVPQPAGPLAALRDDAQPAYRGLMTHTAILRDGGATVIRRWR